MLIGTFCRFSSRFCAVTVTVPSPAVFSSGLGLGWALAGASCAIATELIAIHTATARAARAGRRCCIRTCLLDFRIAVSPVLIRTIDSTHKNSERRHLGIAREHLSQGLLELAQPRLVMPVMILALAVDRLAHLFGAGGAHRAL